jgi:hypothetical protein
VAFYVSKSANLNRPSTGINFDFAQNSIEEFVYAETEQGLVNSVSVGGSSYLIENDYNPGTSSFHLYTDGDLTKASALALGLNTKFSNTSTVMNETGGNAFVVPGLSIQAAVNAAAPGDTIQLSSGEFPLAAAIAVNKAGLTIQGPPTLDAIITGSFGIGDFIQVSANAVTLRHLNVQKTDKSGPQALVYVGADNLTVESCEFSGQYVLGDPEVSRGFIGAYGTSDLTITGNSFHGLRQPGYLNGSLAAPTTGTIANNSVSGTRGWVIDGALMNFTGNMWSGNAVDIALLASTPYSPLYDPISTLSANNNGAIISNQRTAVQVINLDQSTVFPTIQAAIDAASGGDTLEVYPGTFNESPILNKPITLTSSGGRDLTTIQLNATASDSAGSLRITSSDVTLNGFTIAGNDGTASIAANMNVRISHSIDNIVVSNNRIRVGKPHTSNSSDSGIGLLTISNSNNVVQTLDVTGNIFEPLTESGRRAFYINPGVQNFSFDSNTISGDFTSTSITQATNGTVTNNMVTGTGASAGLGTWGHPNPAAGFGQTVFSGNTITGTAAAIQPYSTNGVTISGNTLNNNGTGIWLRISGYSADASTVTIEENNITNSAIAVRNDYPIGTLDATHNYWGSPGPDFGNLAVGAVDTIPWYADAARNILRYGYYENIVISTPQPNISDLYIATGVTVTVEADGVLDVTNLEVADGGSVFVNGGSLTIGESKISGTFTIFNSFGSWEIGGDTTFEIGRSLALISDIHVAPGVTLTVNGGGELILDGCVIDSQTPGSPYAIEVEDDGLLTIARSVVSDAQINIGTLGSSVPANHVSKVYDSRFTASDIEAGPASRVYHNLFDATTAAASNTAATTAFDPVDGWSNVTDASQLQNPFTLEFGSPADPSRTLEDGNLYVQSGDAVALELRIGSLAGHTVTAAEALLGYNSNRMILTGGSPAVTPGAGWEVLIDDDTVDAPLGLVNSTLSLELDPGDDGVSGPATIGTVNFSAGTAGATIGFFRVQTDGAYNPDGSFVRDTRLTKSSGGVPSFLTAFTANTGELVVDNDAPAISETSATGTQVQPSVGAVNILQPSSEFVIRGGSPVVLTFTATDSGLAGLDAADAANDLALTADNGAGTVLDADDYTVSAVEALGVVTYTVTLDVPLTAGNGSYAVTATVLDRSGNESALASLGSFEVANEMLATVELQGFVGTGPGSLRDVTFVATGGTSTKTWTKSVAFTASIGTVLLEEVPDGTTAISAKAGWTLRNKLASALTPAGTGVVAFTGVERLKGGDFNGDNVVNTLDYSILRFHWLSSAPAAAVADVTGDGSVTSADYNVLVPNFYTAGDPQ